MPSRRELANAIRFLSMDAVQKANSGHPGMPMGMADIAEVLWLDFLHHNPKNSKWINRDRFVLSNGHGSMLLYSLLHLSGYDVSIDDLKHFRQLHSKTPGHPEVTDTDGVETTTGPLGQGLANAVGMALAEKILAAHFNRDGFNVVNHYTYVFCGDGCLMEGVSHEVCSLAGTWGLNKLVLFWDDNGISIDGETRHWFTDNIPERFKAYGWQVISHVDGHDAEAVKTAIKQARNEKNRPTIICCKTHIGFGSPNKVDSASAHGSPLGSDEIALVRKALDWKYAPFEIPGDYYEAWDAKEKGAALENEWKKQFEAYEKAYPELAKELVRRMNGELPSDFDAIFKAFFDKAMVSQDKMATRKASFKVLNEIAPKMNELLGGSADLSGSNLTNWNGCKPYSKEHPDADYLFYGVREFGMSAIMNGLSLHGGFIPYGGTFLVFHSYAANAVRMAAMMKKRVIFVYTHDSYGLGEDGPTHQPVEQIATLRLTPNLTVWRPCDLLETAVAWEAAIKREDGPTALLFSRQDLPSLSNIKDQISNIKKGGYIIFDCEASPKSIIIATGSETHLAVEAAKQLTVSGTPTRAVSMPSLDVFFEQDKEYKERVLLPLIPKVVVEAGSGACWYQLIGEQGAIIGLDHFGMSAPAGELDKEFGFTVEHVIETVNQVLLNT